MGDGDVRAWVLRALASPGEPSEAVCAQVLGLGVEAVAPLGEVLERPGPESLLAARLLLRLRAPEALGPLLQRLMRAPPGSVLHVLLLHGLEGLGPAVALPALEALATAPDAEARFGLLRLLAHCGARDERIYTALVAQLQDEPIPGAANLMDYGDARALEPLARALAAQEEGGGEEDVFAWQAVLALEEAIVRLEAEVAEGGDSGGGWGPRGRHARG